MASVPQPGRLRKVGKQPMESVQNGIGSRGMHQTYSQTKTIFLQCDSWSDLTTDYVLDLLMRGTLCTEVGTCTTGITYSAGLKYYLLTNSWDTSLRWQLWNLTVITKKKNTSNKATGHVPLNCTEKLFCVA